MIKRFKTFLYEMALPLSTYKKVISKAKPNLDIRQKYFEIFSNYDTGPRKGKKPYRIYFPYEYKINSNRNSIVTNEIKEFDELFMLAHKKGFVKEIYHVEDYFIGIASNKSGKRLIKIGKLLSQIIKKSEKKDSELAEKFKGALHYFTIDKKRAYPKKQQKYFIVISHHPYDIAGMSTNRSWTSCMTLFPGGRHTFVYSDIKEGTIIAYLVKEDDLNIEKPVGRILLKPYVNISNKKEFILHPSTPYGFFPEKSKKIVYDWCEEVNRKYLGIETKSIYCFNKNLYNDGDDPYIINDFNNLKDDNLSDEFFMSFYEVITNEEPALYKKIGKEICKNKKISLEKCYKFLMLITDNYRYYNRESFSSMNKILEDIPLNRAHDIIEFILKEHKKRNLPNLNILLEYILYIVDSVKWILTILEKYNYSDNCIDRYYIVDSFLKEIERKDITPNEFWNYLRFFNFKEYREDIFWLKVFEEKYVFEVKIPQYYYGNIIATIDKIYEYHEEFDLDIIEKIEKYNGNFLETLKYTNQELFNMIYIDVYYNDKYESLKSMFEKKFPKEELEKIIDDEEE